MVPATALVAITPSVNCKTERRICTTRGGRGSRSERSHAYARDGARCGFGISAFGSRTLATELSVSLAHVAPRGAIARMDGWMPPVRKTERENPCVLAPTPHFCSPVDLAEASTGNGMPPMLSSFCRGRSVSSFHLVCSLNPSVMLDCSFGQTLTGSTRF